MLIQFIEPQEYNLVAKDSFEKIQKTLTMHLGKRLIWHSKHEAGINKELEVVIERLSNRFATVFKIMDNGKKIRYTVNYHNLICGDDHISTK